MAFTNYPADLAAFLSDVDQRLRMLENRQPTSLVMTDASGNIKVDVGMVGSGYGIQINPGVAAAGMSIDSTVPAIKMYDGSGIARVILGEDASIPGSYGIRVNDASGNDIMDSAGLVGAAKLIGTAADPLSGPVAVSTNLTSITGSSNLSFTIQNRNQNVLCLSTINGYATAVSGGPNYIYPQFLVSTFATSGGVWTVGGPSGTITNFLFENLAPGTYTCSWAATTNTGVANFNPNGDVQYLVLQFGG
ncbi:MAG TPA: hypothetical protein VEK76_07700 [Candidatus Binatia bacterium]|nr:hypothetical protein [Candidatus Binatia bacterium]